MAGPTRGLGAAEDEASFSSPDRYDEFFQLLMEYHDAEASIGGSFPPIKDDIVDEKLLEMAKLFRVSLGVLVLATADFLGRFPIGPDLERSTKPPSNETHAASIMGGAHLFETATDSLNRSVETLEETVAERRKYLREMAKIERKIDRNQLATTRVLKELVAGH